MGEALTIPCPRSFDTKKIVFGAKKIGFDAKTADFGAKRIVFGAKTADFGAKRIVFGAKRIVFGAKRIVFGIKRIVFDAKRIVFGTKRIVFGTKRIVFGTKRIVFGTKRIVFDAKRIVFGTKRIVFDAKRIVFGTKRIVFGTKRIVFDAKRIVFGTKRIVFGTKRIVFGTKRIVFGTKRIFFDKRKMQTAVGTLFPVIETIASTTKAIVFLIEITICETRIYSQKRNPFSMHLRSVSLLPHQQSLPFPAPIIAFKAISSSGHSSGSGNCHYSKEIWYRQSVSGSHVLETMNYVVSDQTDERLMHQEQQELFAQALDSLPFKERTAIVLRDIKDLAQRRLHASWEVQLPRFVPK